MERWLIGDVEQHFSEVLRLCETRPQEIYRGDQLVAAVISASDFEQLRRLKESRSVRMLGDAADEIRELCARYDYKLDTGGRRDRDDAMDDSRK